MHAGVSIPKGSEVRIHTGYRADYDLNGALRQLGIVRKSARAARRRWCASSASASACGANLTDTGTVRRYGFALNLEPSG
jgi:hypothetical protein